ncbi:MAG TPA: phosphoribosyltransferase family protein [Candidatus Binatia bacterium]|nr:phosphoribosyltransferase family protein [Candidatus Binatia bacterium]
MTEERALALMAKAGAILTNGHYVYTSELHGSEYVDKNAVYIYPQILEQMCSSLGHLFFDMPVEVVVAPAVGAIDLKTGVSGVIGYMSKRQVLGVFVEQLEMRVEGSPDHVIKLPKFGFKRGYAKHVKGRKVLVVEDVINTGLSVRRTIDAVKEAEGEVLAVGALCNRGSMTAEKLGVPLLESLINIKMKTYKEDECPLCQAGVPVNQEPGHGREFLRKRLVKA